MDILFFLFLTILFAFKLKNIFGVRNDDTKLRNKAVEDFFKEKYGKKVKVVADINELTNLVNTKEKVEPNLDFNIPIEVKNELIKINFNKNNFLKDVEYAVDIISDAFSNQNIDLLKGILSDDMFNNFKNKLTELSKEKKILRSSLISIISKDIEDIFLTGDTSSTKKDINVNVILKTEQINYIENQNKEIIFGDNKKINIIKEKWVFRRRNDLGENSWIVDNIIMIK